MPSDTSVAAPKPTPPALPNTIDKFLAFRKLKARRTINDMVEDVHLALIEDEAYIALLWAVYDEQAVEGSLSADNVLAANMIRDKAKKMENSGLVNEKLATIAKSLGVVLRRYGLDRTSRRNQLDGEVYRAHMAVKSESQSNEDNGNSNGGGE